VLTLACIACVGAAAAWRLTTAVRMGAR
jgi:hypothetical protein